MTEATRTYTALAPRDRTQAGNVGCLLALAAFLLLIGGGIVGVFVVDPRGKGDMWVMPVVGGAFALVGAVLLWGGVRGARGLKVAPAEVAVEGGARLRPGASVGVKVRQPGPITIESLKLRVSCERVYQRRVKRDSVATVEDQERLWEANVVDVAGASVAAGQALEREGQLTLPPDAQPTGPAQPDGRIRWQVEVFVEAGFLRATYRAFDLFVQAGAE